MKQKYFIPVCLIFLGLLCGVNSFSQGFAGARAGKNAGLTGVFNNPAHIAAGNSKWNINIGGGSASFAFNGSAATDSVFDRFKESSFFKYSEERFKLNMALNADLYGPGVSYSFLPGQAAAFTTRFRAMGNLHELGGSGSSTADSLFNYSGTPVQKLSLNTWTEYGVSYAAKLINTPKHSITGGVTVKYLTGLSNNYLYAENLNVQGFGGNNSYITNTNGILAMGSSANPNKKHNGFGLGVDAGFIYERKNNATGTHKAPYKYRIGFSVLDVGAIRYTANDSNYADYKIHIANGQKFMLNELDNKSNAEVKNILNGHPDYFTSIGNGNRKYTVNLPASALVSVDVALNQFFFAELSSSISLAGKTDRFGSFSPNYISVTPRFERKRLALYMPVTVHEIGGFNAGLSIKFGAFYIGSNSLFIWAKEDKGLLDVHAGISLRIK